MKTYFPSETWSVLYNYNIILQNRHYSWFCFHLRSAPITSVSCLCFFLPPAWCQKWQHLTFLEETNSWRRHCHQQWRRLCFCAFGVSLSDWLSERVRVTDTERERRRILLWQPLYSLWMKFFFLLSILLDFKASISAEWFGPPIVWILNIHQALYFLCALRLCWRAGEMWEHWPSMQGICRDLTIWELPT